MAIALRKWKAVFDIYFQDGLAYRASGIIWIMTDLVTAVTMPLVWASAARSGPIQGYTTGDFVLYYLCLLLLQSFITSHIMWEVATEIKEGQFTPLLLRPVSLPVSLLPKHRLARDSDQPICPDLCCLALSLSRVSWRGARQCRLGVPCFFGPWPPGQLHLRGHDVLFGSLRPRGVFHL